LVNVTQIGLTSSFASPLTQLKVCGNPAILSVADSTANSALLFLPPLVTVYSMENFGIAKESYIKGVHFSSSVSAQ
jgi:hypothetical protein